MTGAYRKKAVAGRSPRVAEKAVILVLRVLLVAGPARRLGAPVRGDMRVFPAPRSGRPCDLGGIMTLGAGHRAGLHGRFPSRVAFGTGKARVGVAERSFGGRACGDGPDEDRKEQNRACQWQRVSHNRSSGCAGDGFARGFPRSTLFRARPQACFHKTPCPGTAPGGETPSGDNAFGDPSAALPAGRLREAPPLGGGHGKGDVPGRMAGRRSRNACGCSRNAGDSARTPRTKRLLSGRDTYPPECGGGTGGGFPQGASHARAPRADTRLTTRA